MTIGITVVVLVSFPANLIGPMAMLMMGISAIWVYMDAKKIDIKKYKSNLGSPLELVIFTLVMWQLFLPLYLDLRYRIKHNLVPVREK